MYWFSDDRGYIRPHKVQAWLPTCAHYLSSQANLKRCGQDQPLTPNTSLPLSSFFIAKYLKEQSSNPQGYAALTFASLSIHTTTDNSFSAISILFLKNTSRLPTYKTKNILLLSHLEIQMMGSP
uniref:Uncharacterized protein n=1 Tax=Myotis myotis TaxID=51298 RepID=A0A7J8ANC3_MYOMY|nr:hypothetical protein mMyoMyo1_008068 [Myotis myotis]